MSSRISEYTVSEKILLAAYELDKAGETSFTAETLIVTAWKRFPSTFGLKGYADKYPDSNKVLTSIMGERGLARKGWLVKLGKKLYSITTEGRRAAQKLLGKDAETDEYAQLSKEKETLLRKMLSSSALQKFDYRKAELGFADACRFWDISQNVKGKAIDDRLSYIERMLNELEQDLAEKDAKLPGGKIVTAGDIRALRNVHRYMEDLFEPHLNIYRRR